MSIFSRTQIYNMVLSSLGRGGVSSPNENGPAAASLNLWYPLTFAYLLGRADWNFGRVRVTLAQQATNPRPDEWGFAYAQPADLAMITRLLPALGDIASLGVFVPQTGQTVAITSIPDTPGLPFDWAGTTIFSNEEAAVLEYISDLATFNTSSNALFVAALVARLAQSICMDVTKDNALAAKLTAPAELAEQRAIAANNNAKRQTYGDFIPEDVLAREGIDPFIQWPARWY